MKNYQTEFLSQYISNLRISRNLTRLAYQAGNALYINNHCVLLSREGQNFAFTIEDNYQDFRTDIFFDETQKKIESKCNCKAIGFCSHKVSALLQLHEDLSQELGGEPRTGIKYTRDGMIKRVMAEREEKAINEKFQLDFADNIYGEHLITNQRNKTYQLTFYDFDKKQGYCSCPDHQTNKLGTCKHLIYAFEEFNKSYQKNHSDQEFPFLEVFLHPLKEYRISYFFTGRIPAEIQALVNVYFDEEQQVSAKKILEFQGFIREAQKHKFIKIRPEVLEKIKKETELQSLNESKSKSTLNFDSISINLYPFQKQGVDFLVFKKGAILADEVGLGKTIQAIVAAHFKKELLNLQSTLIVCPDNLINHWEQEIKKTVNETFTLIKESKDFFADESFFKIIGFDDFARQSFVFDSYSPDLLIIDEAQKISNFDSDLVRILRRVKHRHLLIITDSKPENNLMQYYSMVGLVDNSLLTPLWEFSYQHCLFDSQIIDKVIGYYNQETIVRRIQSILLRREKDDVINQLQKINRLIVPVNSVESKQLAHQKIAEETLFLLNKKIKTTYDWQNIAQFLIQMKGIASLVYFEKEAGTSAKFGEFKHFLLEKVNLANVSKKIIVFAEKEETRRHLNRYFKESHIPTETINHNQNEDEIKIQFERFSQNKNSSVLLLQEGINIFIPIADAVIYYDLCLNQQAVEKRYELLQQQYAVQPPLLVHFLSQNTIEYSLFQLVKDNRVIFNEIAFFMNKTNEDIELSEDSQSELRKILFQFRGQKNKQTIKSDKGQTSLFSFIEDNQPISLSGEEHKVFEIPSPNSLKFGISLQKESTEAELQELLYQAQAFLSNLYSLQTGKELPWKAEDIDLDISEKEIVLRINRK